MRVVILGSTGSIGRQALEVARWRSAEVVGLVAGSRIELLAEQCAEFRPRVVGVNAELADRARRLVPAGTRVLANPDAALAAVGEECDVVVAAITGLAGLPGVRAALEAGRRVALANKEAMVAAGELVWSAARAGGGEIVPVDSEHSAIAQCLAGEDLGAVEEILLTASGGPFRTRTDLSKVTPEEALLHPTWKMGPKVTIDSATLMNKGLEVLEAHALFGLEVDRIKVVIHPQSLVHSFVRFRDGNLKAQAGVPDMRIPINYALGAPARVAVPAPRLEIGGAWTFEPPDEARFPCLPLAYSAGRRGGLAPAALNAADEVAVGGFLAGRLSFGGIAEVIAGVVAEVPDDQLSWDTLAQVDAWSRARAEELVRGGAR